jgi:hypothetical protein
MSGDRIGLTLALRGRAVRFGPPSARNELLRSMLLLLVVLQGHAWCLTSVQAEGVAREGAKEPRIRTSSGTSSLSTVSAPPTSLHAHPTLSPSDPISPSNIVEKASSGLMQGLAAEASSDETTPTSGSSPVLLHDHRPEHSSPTARFDFSSPSNPG